MKLSLFLPSLLLLVAQASAQSTHRFAADVTWTPSGEPTAAFYDEAGVPYYSLRIAVPGRGRAVITQQQLEYVSSQSVASLTPHEGEVVPELSFATVRRREYLTLSVPMLRRAGSTITRLATVDVSVQILPEASPTSATRSPGTLNSVLSDATTYKIGVPTAGMYVLTHGYLRDELGIDVDNLNARHIKLYTNGGGRLPERNDVDRVDDLVELPLLVIGEADGSFDEGDRVVFYSEGPHTWSYDAATQAYRRDQNIYSDLNHLFLKVDGGEGLRISEGTPVSSAAYTTTAFDGRAIYEREENNLLSRVDGTIGSGQRWFGDYFAITTSRDYTFQFPNRVSNEPIVLRSALAARHSSSSQYTISTGGQTFTSSSIGAADLSGSTTAVVARVGSLTQSINTNQGDQIDLTLTYNAPGAEGWLDYIELTARRELRYGGQPLLFRDGRTLAESTARYLLAGVGDAVQVWDVTTDYEAERMLLQGSGGVRQFNDNTGGVVREYVAFDPATVTSTPVALGEVAPQNLHGLTRADYVIIAHPDFMSAATSLAAYRAQQSGMVVEVVDVLQLYNEFGGGSLDPTAIRDFIRMLYERDPQFRYVLLYGDGTYDYKNVENAAEHHQYIPVFESAESLSGLYSYPSDDYFVLMDDNEGALNVGGVDLGIGRFPVRTATDADRMVQKVKTYETDPATLGEWRTRLTFTADDEDFNRHFEDSENVNQYVESAFPVFNLNKIYFDAFPQVATSGNSRFPKAEEALNESVQNGSLVSTYLGHGGPNGWAQERVLSREDVSGWSNADRLTLFVTATCELAPFDDAVSVSIGEDILLKNGGGAIGLLTTTRAVFTGPNAVLTRTAHEELYTKEGGQYRLLGDVLMMAKNAQSSSTFIVNARKFALLGDPSMRLALPQYNITTRTINGTSATDTDTLRAMQKVTLTGAVTDEADATLTAFNGIVNVTVFDKAKVRSTLASDPTSDLATFTERTNIMFRGQATVSGGEFSITFVVPKDIDYAYGLGRISYYAHDGQAIDAAGYYENIVIGGTDPNAAEDDEGPQVEVYMNDEQFVSGGLTSPDPVLYLKLSDDNGINVTGNSIGHDLTAILDDNTQNTLVLNEFYQAAVDDYTSGTVRYQLNDIEPGLHTVRVKAWDVANNSATGYTEFLVVEDAAAALEHVLNYPNPFTTSTEFQFEHNLTGNLLDVQVQVYTVNGRLVKTINSQQPATGYRMTGITWDGTDDFGDQLARGVYLYRVQVRAIAGEQEREVSSDFEKLVILK